MFPGAYGTFQGTMHMQIGKTHRSSSSKGYACSQRSKKAPAVIHMLALERALLRGFRHLIVRLQHYGVPVTICRLAGKKRDDAAMRVEDLVRRAASPAAGEQTSYAGAR